MGDPDSSLNEFISNAAELAHRAVQHDNEKNYEVSIYFYAESINLLERARKELQSNVDGLLVENSSSDLILQKKKKILSLETKMNEYQTRINCLDKGIGYRRISVDFFNIGFQFVLRFFSYSYQG